ncbi:putative type I restriction enzymeP M protein [Streptomyces sp. S4.7]|uniref:N-6 DNA methylase n=1 Tax=Streptomyces sp. S4.7 TaxID=2705439 RepID=UPI0013989C1A|nr:N-6 DNA methylase [Streptomyces sp. S4.7]QHY97005.1 putative type I restriction enzymeP M protein [Streptomyces sp. S4.7]
MRQPSSTQHSQPSSSPQVTAAEISRIAGVTRATVSNWRRRHENFPVPVGGTESSPLYDLRTVQDWLENRGHTSTASPAEELRTVLRLHGGSGLAVRLMASVAAASRRTPEELAELAAAPDDELIALAAADADRLREAVPVVERVRYGAKDAGVVRALLRCVHGAGPQAALDVLAERALDESAATGTYETPGELATLMASLLPVDAGSVFDPACGSGTLLAAAARRGAYELYGQDVVAVQAQRAAVHLLLETPPATDPIRASDPVGGWAGAATVSVGDSLRADAFSDLTVDAVLCNPPFGDRDWGHEELAYDPRWAYGPPPRSESELAWVQHALAHVASGGLAVLLLPPALASRPSARRVRAELVRSGALRAVVSLPAGVAPPLHIGLHIWVLRRPEPGGTERQSVLFVSGERERENASGGGVRKELVNWSALTARVLDQWTAFSADPDAFTDEPGVARAVRVIDLLGDVVDLTPARHVRVTATDIDPETLARRVADLHSQLNEQLAALAAATVHGKWQPSPDASAGAWRTATVADLARGGALTLLRGAAVLPVSQDSVREGTPERAGAGAPVLTTDDVSAGRPPSGPAERLGAEATQTVAEGDVILRGDAPTGVRRPMTRVADGTDAGALLGPRLHLLRPDPARLDPWFLAGFVGTEDNIAAASTGTTVVHVNPGRLRVPLLPLEEQRRYGEAFRRVHELRVGAVRVADLAMEAAGAVSAGLTTGALLPRPPDGESVSESA